MKLAATLLMAFALGYLIAAVFTFALGNPAPMRTVSQFGAIVLSAVAGVAGMVTAIIVGLK